MSLSKSTLLALLPFFLAAPSLAAVSGSGTTTRYWDCCKPSCSWSNKATLSTGPVLTCDKDDNPLSSPDVKSACDGGSAYMCSNESPWAVTDDLAYGYAAVHIAGGTENSWCCACYELTFTSGPVQGKKMVVQATNTGGDLGDNHFDISIPGGGFGIFNGCTPQYGTPSTGWGEQYGGISSRSQCDAFPEKLKDGCYWRYDWFKNADNPTMTFKQVNCPKALTAKSGCVRADDSPVGDAVVSTQAAVASTQAAVVSAPVADVSTKAAAVPAPVADASTNAAAVPTPVADASTNAAAVPTPVADASTNAAAAPTPIADASTKAADVSTPAAAAPTPVADASTKAADASTKAADASTKPLNISPAPSAAEASTAILPPPVATMTEWVCDGASATVPKYGRCGGSGYTGPTVCEEGSKCVVSNEWYSQCV